MRIIIHDLDTQKSYEPRNIHVVKPEHLSCYEIAIKLKRTFSMGDTICEVKI